MIEKWTKKSKKVPKSFFSFRAHNFFLDHHIGLETSEIESPGFLDELKKKSDRKIFFFVSKKIFEKNKFLEIFVLGENFRY